MYYIWNIAIYILYICIYTYIYIYIICIYNIYIYIFLYVYIYADFASHDYTLFILYILTDSDFYRYRLSVKKLMLRMFVYFDISKFKYIFIYFCIYKL